MNLLVNAKHAMETPGQIRWHEEGTHLHTDEQREIYLVLAYLDRFAISRFPWFTDLCKSEERFTLKVKRAKGHSFSCIFPALKSVRLAQEVYAIAAVTSGADSPHSVLLVDDNDDVRFISKVYLESAGFTVVECGNGADALDLLADEHNEFVLVITDMIMQA